MNRRSLFLASAASSILASLPSLARGGLRLSTTEGEPGYDEWMSICERGDKNKIKVYFDGVNINSSCRAASEPEGYVWVAKKDVDGNMYADPKTDEIAEEQLFGRVRITLS